jgi:acyl-CoA synthetase (AMP-forming)/AMP-acid ligase II
MPASVKGVFVVGDVSDGMLSYEDVIVAGDSSLPLIEARPDAPILIRYTGGTTGRAKGIVHTDASLTNMHRDLISEFTIREWDVALHLGHLSHGSNFAWAAFYGMGATQILRERFDPNGVLRDIAGHRVTFTYMVPTMLQRVLREDDGSADVSSLTRVWVSSAPIPVPVIRQAIARFGNIFVQAYTLSECPPVTTVLRPEEIVDKTTRFGPRIGSCGREALTMEIRLLDDEGRDVPDGEVGEIAIRSINNMSEYWRLPDETRKTLVDGWLRTGDMAGRDEDGYLYIVDRKKDVIITGGFNVYPKEIEDVIYTHPDVAAVGVVGVPDEELGESIVAYVVVREGAALQADALIHLCRENLASYKKPRDIRFVPELPLTPVGKVSRRELRDIARGKR